MHELAQGSPFSHSRCISRLVTVVFRMGNGNVTAMQYGSGVFGGLWKLIMRTDGLVPVNRQFPWEFISTKINWNYRMDKWLHPWPNLHVDLVNLNKRLGPWCLCQCTLQLSGWLIRLNIISQVMIYVAWGPWYHTTICFHLLCLWFAR